MTPPTILCTGSRKAGFFHSYYRDYRFLPLYVFCGDQCLVSYLHPSNIDGAKHSWAILALLVKRLLQAWPGVAIRLRGDSGFCRHRMLGWCERHGINYIVRLAKNPRLSRLSQPWVEQAESQFEAEQQKQRLFTEFHYQAGTWKRQRRVIVKAEQISQGNNPRYMVTNLTGDPHHLQPVVSESIPLAAVDTGVSADQCHSPHRFAANRTGSVDVCDDPIDTL